MKILLIYCHPAERSFAHHMCEFVYNALYLNGHAVTKVDLYNENFDPIIREGGWVCYQELLTDPFLQKYVEQLRSTDALIFIYPAWWYGMPAMLKGYFDKIWSPGVAFDILPDGSVNIDKLAHIKRIAVITTYGGPRSLICDYVGDPARKLMTKGVGRLCAPDCKIDWYAKYEMDRATPQQLNRFLKRVKRGLDGWT